MPRIREQITGSGFIVRSPRILLDELDNHAGSYSTVQRTGDTSRPGTLATNFDDSTTIIFSETGNPVFPSMLPRGNTFNSQAVDILGQESDISITAPIRSAQHPTYLHYSPAEQMGPFNENRVMPATDFFLSGTDPEIMPGFTSPLRSKIAITFDITPQTETLLTRNVKSRAEAEQGARAVGTLTVSPSIPAVGQIVTIVSRDGFTKDYIFTPGANGTLDGSVPPKVIVSSDGGPTINFVAQRYREAINSLNGHAARINCTNAFNVVTLTQTVGGTAGNTTIGIGAPGTNLTKVDFAGGLNNGSSIENQSGFMYYNFVRKEWEQIGLNDPAPGNALLDFDYAFNSSAASGTFPAQFSISPSFSNETVDARVNEGYDKIGSPTEIMGAPGDTKYHATSSQTLRLSNYINSPMLLEGISVNFKNVWARRVQGDCLSSNQADRNGAARDIDNYTFFAYRQDRSLSNDFVRDSISNISGSTRSLIFSGSMSFWNSGSFFNDNTAGARLLHSPAFDYNFGLLYTNNFLVGQYKGPVGMQLKPAVAGRQMTGLGRYFNIGSQTSVLSRNFWPGGTSPKKSQKLWTIAGSPSVIDAYGWTSNPDSTLFSQMDDSRAFRVHGGEAAPANLASSEQGLLVSSRVEQSAVSPYLLLPTDELVFGLEAGLSQLAGSLMFSSITGSHIRIFPEDCQVTFYGSLIQDNKEHTLSLNQNLSSNAVHEIIGAEPVLDQFQIEPISSYHGSYLDEIVTGSMANPSANTTLFTIFDQDNSRRIISRVSLGQAGTTGSLQRFVKMIDQTERTYDSCLPNFNVMLPSATKTASEYSYISENVPLFTGVEWEQEKDLPESIVLQFPFASNPTRNKQKTIGIVGATFTDDDDVESTTYIASSPADITGRELDDMNILYKTRYEYVSYAASNDAYDINQTFYTFETTRPINITDGLVSYYRLEAIFPQPSPLVVAALEDSMYSNDLTGTPTDQAASPVTHTAPVYNKGSPLFPAGTFSLGKLAYSSFNTAGLSANVSYFEDAGDYADHKMVNNVSSPTADVPFSLSCVFYLENLGTTQTLIERRNTTAREYTLEVTAANYLKFYKGRGNTTTDFRSVLANASGADLDADTWHHVLVTYNGVDSNSGDNVKIYINGVLQTTKTLSFVGSPAIMNTNSSSRLRLGTGMTAGGTGIIPDAATEIRGGRIFSVGIWKNKELSAQDANDLYQAELVGSCVGNVRHRVGAVDSFIGKALAFRYGISNIDPEFSSVRWNATSFGQPRDMLESRLGITTSDGTPPVKIHFVSGSTYNANPNNTHAQNISVFATSSIPWIDDGLFRNREDNPDETLLII